MQTPTMDEAKRVIRDLRRWVRDQFQGAETQYTHDLGVDLSMYLRDLKSWHKRREAGDGTK